VVAATHRDLASEVQRGRFRQDLYYRLNVVTIRLPPLRERPDDLEALVHDLLVDCNRRLHRTLHGVTPAAMAVLAAYPWPGNVRELRNVLERAFVLEPSDLITPGSLALSTSVSPAEAAAQAVDTLTEARLPKLAEFVEEQERHYLRLVLDKVGGNVTRAAEILDLTRPALHRKLKRMGLRARPEEPSPDDEDS
jgi:DNA-binding NtrC family response regulator